MNEPTTTGGNSTLTNGNEAEVIARTVDSVPVVVAPGGEDDHSHVSPQFKKQGL